MALQVVVSHPDPVSFESGDTRSALFFELDARVRQIEQRFKSTWMELSGLCIQIKKDSLWREGGYDSYGQWLASACPCSRTYAYASVKAREELQDVPEEDLQEIPLSNAVTLQQTPRNRRTKALIQKAKRESPGEFRETIEDEVPEAHVERILIHRFRLNRTGSKTLRAGLEMWRMLNDDPAAPVEAALEGLVADYMLMNQQTLEAKLKEMNR